MRPPRPSAGVNQAPRERINGQRARMSHPHPTQVYNVVFIFSNGTNVIYVFRASTILAAFPPPIFPCDRASRGCLQIGTSRYPHICIITSQTASQGSQTVPTPSAASSAGPSKTAHSKPRAKVARKAVSTRQADRHATLDGDDVAPQPSSTSPPVEDPTATEPEVSVQFIP
jgi:hypothetical protein